jgi:hypothetical protein
MNHKLKIDLNDVQNLRDLLQEAYSLASEQIIQVQNEINKMASATQLEQESIEGKARYGKIINDYLGIKDKAISKKIDIAKILSDIHNHNDNMNGNAEHGENMNVMDFNFDDIKKMVDESYENKDKTKTIELNKK